MLVDSDVLVWYMRGHSGAGELLDNAPGFSISAISYMELVQGMRDKKELRAWKRALDRWTAKVLTIDDRITTQAMIFVERYFHSHSIRMADALIGATAISHGLSLHTANRKHYRMLKGLELVPFVPANGPFGSV